MEEGACLESGLGEPMCLASRQLMSMPSVLVLSFSLFLVLVNHFVGNFYDSIYLCMELLRGSAVLSVAGVSSKLTNYYCNGACIV